MMIPAFETDAHPGKPRILFIGLAQSSHTHAWIDLLSASEFNVRLFALPNGLPPSDWQVKTYVNLPHSQNNTWTRKHLYAHPIGRFRKHYNELAAQVGLHQIGTSEEWLSYIIKSWRPDIIHTLGLEPASYYYFDVRKKYALEAMGKWIVQVRGGPDLALNRFLPNYAQKIRAVFQACHQVIADNQQNYEYAVEMGLPRDRICELGTLPGSGGIDVEGLEGLWQNPPSSRERIIVWPKSYEGRQSKSLPVFEALKLAWDRIFPCRIFMFAANQETTLWFQNLPEHIRQASCISYRVPRDEVLSCLLKARVMLAPSISDGVPNTLYEAMASGALPIVSPLETIVSVVNQKENALFARNLYPHEIADALSRAMNDDALVDQAAKNNFQLVRKIADRQTIKAKMVNYYQKLAADP